MVKPVLITLGEAAALCAEHGLTDLGRKFWVNQTDRGQVACSVVVSRKLIRRDYVEGMLEKAVTDASAPPCVIRDWQRKAAKKAALQLAQSRQQV